MASDSGVAGMEMEVDEEPVDEESLRGGEVIIGEDNAKRKRRETRTLTARSSRSTSRMTNGVDQKIQKLPNCKVVLSRVRLNQIRITAPQKNKREICYTGFDPDDVAEGDDRKYRDWRSETIPALGRRNPGSQERDINILLEISPEHSSIFSINGVKDDVHSVLDVLTGQKMSTMVLDAFLNLRILAHNSCDRSGSSSLAKKLGNQQPTTTYGVLSVHFLPIYDRDQNPSTFKPNLHLFPKFPLNNCILIAPQYICKHYYLTIFNFTCKTVYVYDSSWQYVPMFHRFHQVRNILKSLIGGHLRKNENRDHEDSWDIYFVEKCAQQADEVNCGCYVIYFTENELKGKAYKNEINIGNSELVQIRQEIIKEILPSTETGRRLLEAIST